MRLALLVNEDGTTSDLDLDSGNATEILQAAVKGWFQVIEINEHVAMWLNEEGKYTAGLELNRLGTALLHDAGGIEGDYVVGPIVLTGGTDDDGETLALSQADGIGYRILAAVNASRS